MILDKQLVFSDAQAVTASANSSNILDLSAIRDVGTGENLYLVVVCVVAMTDGSSNSTVAVTLASDDNESLSTPTTRMTIGTFAALSAAGTRFVARLQPEVLGIERYLGVVYTVANGDLTTGSFDAFICHDVDLSKAYADGVTIQ